MEVIIVCIILLIILYFLTKKLSQRQEITLEEMMEPINKMNNEYEEKLKRWCIENKVTFKENITKTSEIWVNQIPGYIWFDSKDIIFCPDAINCGIPINIENRIILIKYDKIKYFTKDGTVNYTNKIINNGKNVSISGAVIGEYIAGEAGAIIGSRKDMIKIENVTVKHDDIYTYIYFERDNEIKLAEVKGSEFYQRILHLIPEKEYYYILNKNNI